MKFKRVKEAINRIKNGQMVILVDDEDRENEGDLVLAAEKVSPEAVNFMAMHGRGLICLTLSEERCDELELPMMVKKNTAKFSTAFTVSIEAKEGVTTGISAHDRAHTIATAIDPDKTSKDLAHPGHVFPLRSKNGGVLVRTGQTEGSVDLARLAGLNPSAVICEIMKEDGSMARRADLEVFSKKHAIPIVSIEEMVSYRMETESLVEERTQASLPTMFSKDFEVKIFESKLDHYQHVALVKGPIDSTKPTLVRVHSECFTGDVLGSLRCDCRDQLHKAMELISASEQGILLYLRQEGRGIGLVNKLKAYALQDEGHDTVEANHKLGFKSDLREYGVGAQILKQLGVIEMKLLTNNPRKVVGVQGFGIKVIERVPLQVPHNEVNAEYMETKRKKLGHLFQVN